MLQMVSFLNFGRSDVAFLNFDRLDVAFLNCVRLNVADGCILKLL